MIPPERHSLELYSMLLAQEIDWQVTTYYNKTLMRSSYQYDTLDHIYMS